MLLWQTVEDCKSCLRAITSLHQLKRKQLGRGAEQSYASWEQVSEICPIRMSRVRLDIRMVRTHWRLWRVAGCGFEIAGRRRSDGNPKQKWNYKILFDAAFEYKWRPDFLTLERGMPLSRLFWHNDSQLLNLPIQRSRFLRQIRSSKKEACWWIGVGLVWVSLNFGSYWFFYLNYLSIPPKNLLSFFQKNWKTLPKINPIWSAEDIDKAEVREVIKQRGSVYKISPFIHTEKNQESGFFCKKIGNTRACQEKLPKPHQPLKRLSEFSTWFC